MAESTKTIRKMALFGKDYYKPDFEWSIKDHTEAMQTEKAIKLSGFNWKE